MWLEREREGGQGERGLEREGSDSEDVHFLSSCSLALTTGLRGWGLRSAALWLGVSTLERRDFLGSQRRNLKQGLRPPLPPEPRSSLGAVQSVPAPGRQRASRCPSLG